jgi:predicted nucleic acid-binding protein
MLVVDASCLVRVLIGATSSDTVRERLAEDADHVAPHVVDVEVFGVIRRELLLGRIDRTAADQAVDDLRDWPGERVGHQPLLARAWELRATIRGWDAMYVALAEAMACPLLTSDARLASADTPRCRIDVV